MIANRVGLSDHTFEVEVGVVPAGQHATCRCVEARAYALVTVGQSFFALDKVEQHEVLVHEVLHPLLHPLMQHVSDLREELGRSHYETLERLFRRDLERVTDRFASVLSDFIPPPL